jgi:phospho-N-acetylmuramoyl-pentapeptide-transferase
LAGRFKIFGQVMLGIIVGATLLFTKSVVVKREVYNPDLAYVKAHLNTGERLASDSFHIVKIEGKEHIFAIVKTPITTIPFVKTHEFNYAKILPKSWGSTLFISSIS